jgi:hypothetical protein
MTSKEEFALRAREAVVAVNTGDTVLARQLLQTLAALRPGIHRKPLRIEAMCAAREGRFDEAARLWRTYDRRFGIDSEDALRFGRALEACGDIAGALAVYRAMPILPGTDHRGALAEAALHGRFDHVAAALGVLDHAVQESAGSALEAGIRQVRARQAMLAERMADALTDYVAIDRLTPREPVGLAGQIDIHLRNRDAASAEAVLKLAADRFPNVSRFIELAALLVNQRGGADEMAAFAAQLAGRNLSEPALRGALLCLCRGRLQHFDAALRDRLAGCFAGGPGAAVAQAVLNERAPDTEARLAQAQGEMDAQRDWPDSPAGIRARANLATHLIEVGRIDAATAIADGLAATVRDWPYAPPILGPVLEWRLVRQGAIRAAQQSYWARRRMIATRDRTDELECVRTPAGRPPSVTVFCQLRNEMTVLPAFFRHYRTIGVERFVIVDNGSTDGAFDWLAAQPDVELYRTTRSFRRAMAGNAWINPLIARPDYADTLCLRVDADEHLVYPHFETLPVTALWQHMQGEGAEVIAGHMLDMLPERLADLDAPGGDFTRVARFFDAPPEPTPTAVCPYLRYSGGPRTRLLGSESQHLTKTSGLRGGGVIEQIGASHQTSPARVSSIGMVLLHYKFRPDFFDRARQIAGEHQYSAASQEYARYGQLEAIRDASLLTGDTHQYTGSASLIEAGVLRSTAAWDARLKATMPPPVVVTWPQGEIVRNNWGDKLNPHLVELLSGRPVLNEAEATDLDPDVPCYSVIGSHLGRMTHRHIVWGTGFISATGRVIAPPREIRAVRGPLSRAMLLAQGVDCPEVYGDPALLYPLFYRPDVSKTHDLGIILHVRDRGVTTLPPVPERLTVREIDITGDLHAVVDAIASCRHIVSTSLHGLIAAHAYGVPAAWISVGNRVKGDGLKFRDYLASVGISDAAPDIVTSETDLRAAFGRCRLPERMVDLATLVACCPFLDPGRRADLVARARQSCVRHAAHGVR